MSDDPRIGRVRGGSAREDLLQISRIVVVERTATQWGEIVSTAFHGLGVIPIVFGSYQVVKVGSEAGTDTDIEGRRGVFPDHRIPPGSLWDGKITHVNKREFGFLLIIAPELGSGRVIFKFQLLQNKIFDE